MTDKTREAIIALFRSEMDINQPMTYADDPSQGFTIEGMTLVKFISTLDRIASLITAQADGVTDDIMIWDAACEYCEGRFAAGSKEYTSAHAAFVEGQMRLRSKLAAPKQDGWVSVDERLPDVSVHGEKVLLYRVMNESQSGLSISVHDTYMVKHCDKSSYWQSLPAPPKPSHP